MTDELKSSRTTLNRYPGRGHHDFETIAAILDEAFVCHVGFVTNGQPYVIPTVYGRDDKILYLHGAAAGRLLTSIAEAEAICVTVTLVDGLVLARSGLHSSINLKLDLLYYCSKLTKLLTVAHQLTSHHFCRQTRAATPRQRVRLSVQHSHHWLAQAIHSRVFQLTINRILQRPSQLNRQSTTVMRFVIRQAL